MIVVKKPCSNPEIKILFFLSIHRSKIVANTSKCVCECVSAIAEMHQHNNTPNSLVSAAEQTHAHVEGRHKHIHKKTFRSGSNYYRQMYWWSISKNCLSLQIPWNVEKNKNQFRYDFRKTKVYLQFGYRFLALSDNYAS